MLASTVQFSNNDQPPITPPTKGRVHWGRQPKDRLIRARTFRHPTACPTRPTMSCFPRRSSTRKKQPVVPNSQRSTLEQPPSDICRRNGLWIPCGT